MGRKKSIVATKRSVIIHFYKSGKSMRKIARKTGVSKGAVQNVINIFKETGNYSSRKSTGSPRVTSKREDKLIVRHSIRNRRMMAPQLTPEINETRTNNVSLSTVKRRLQTVAIMEELLWGNFC